MENNRLIADFMGGLHPMQDIKVIDHLKYHSSWDWLMPVVKKCYEHASLGSEHRQAIEESLLGIIDINNTYEPVVECIEWLNESN